jgi:mRNA interferase YafQ
MAQADDSTRRVVRSRSFERDAKRLHKRGKDMGRLLAVIEALRLGTQLEPRHRDHSLVGDWRGYRECHVEPNWLLIYRLDDDAVYLARTGTHSDLFG